MNAIKNMSLIKKLLLAIILGIIIGQLQFLPVIFFQLIATLSGIFSSILNFVLPLMVVAFVVAGITRLTVNAGKLLGMTALVGYISLLAAASIAFIGGQLIFPMFINEVHTDLFSEAAGIAPLFEFQISGFFSVPEAAVFAFITGLGISALNREGKGFVIRDFFYDFQEIITKTLNAFIIPLLPFYVFSNFMSLSFSGNVVSVLKLFGPVYLMIIGMHFIYLFLILFIGSRFSESSIVKVFKNTLPAYLTAFGTQSSAATIPVNVQAAKDNGISDEVAEFMIPLTATLHLPGSMITVSSLTLAIVMITGGDSSVAAMFPFYMTVALALIAAPGVPGGGIMTALPYTGMVGLPIEGTIPSLLISLYLTQDSFGTSINVSADQGIAPIINKYYSDNYHEFNESESISDK